jgi:hypothetical protein
MYDEFRHDLPKTSPTLNSRNVMKKWLLVAIALLALSGCSWSKVLKWIDQMEWERDDQTVRIVDFLIR